MTDRKISELTSITGANVDDAADELVIVDTSATETKKITRGELFKDISTDITLGDNGKAIFGAGNDLQLYHNGTNSIVADTGSGSLSLQTNGSSVTLWDTTNAQYMGAFNVGGEVGLYHNGNKKFATTSTGIDVTGSVVSDGLTSQIATTGRSILATFQNSALLAAGNQATIELKNSGQSAFISAESAQVNAGVDLLFSSNNGTGTETNRMRIAENGDISFYEDTGTTAQMVWDASADALTFGDNVKATFGAGSDLEIYHDGSDSFIVDNGAGNLAIRGASAVFLQSTSGETYFRGDNNGAVKLYYDNSEKLATTSTGIDVTGTVTADGLTVADGTSGQINVHSSSYNIQGGTNYGDLRINAPRFRFFEDGTTLRMNIDNGDISFYEDTGTTPKFFWDASAESLGIGTTSPRDLLNIFKGTGQIGARFQNTATGTTSGDGSFVGLGIAGGSTNGLNLWIYESTDMAFGTANTERMRIDSSGNVGIGTSSPAYTLDVTENNSSGAIRIYDSGTGGIDTRLIAANSGNGGTGRGVAISLQPSGSSNSVEAVKLVGLQETASATANDSSFAVQVANTSGTLTERMRIDSSGNVGIGTTSPGSKLSVVGLPTSSAGLSAGDIWNDGGTLKIV